MDRGLLVVNAGSSSLKYAVYRDPPAGEPERVVGGQIDGIAAADVASTFVALNAAGREIGRHHWPTDQGDLSHDQAFAFLGDWLKETLTGLRLVAVGHRVVHGGVKYDRPILVTAEVLADLETLTPLAPLHQPHNLAPIKAIAARMPDLPQIACFDTSFHRTLPRTAQILAIPRDLTEAGVLRYGFHGISYESIARQLPAYAPTARRVVVAHLGNGASMCAMRDGRSVDSTMGFTAVDGLPMGTRSGALDPGVLLYLMREKGYDAQRLERFLYKECGLLGVSGLGSDMRDLLASRDPRAAEAVDVFCYAIAKFLGALAMTLGGLDALVFTAGIGEHAAPVRARVCEQAAWLGVILDPAANAKHGPCITAEGSSVSAWVIPTDEERMIAQHTRDLLRSARARAAPS